ncbi:MAG: DUF58 domain-containing protein [Streptosporangiaceae bacterium]
MTQRPLEWRPSARMRSLLTVSVAALIAALVVRSPELAVLAAPLLLAVAAGAGRQRPTELGVSVEVGSRRCFEGEKVDLSLRLHTDSPPGQIEAALDLPASVEVVDGSPRQSVAGTHEVEVGWAVRPSRWGRWSLGPVRIAVRDRGRLHTAEQTVTAGELWVFPRPPRLTRLVLPATLPERIGDHTTRVPGEGTEFVGIRPYVPGDWQRRINWPATTRRGRLHVNQFAVEHAADVVVVIDALSDVGPPDQTTLDLSVRGAAGIASGYLRGGADRVGIVTLGGMLRWLGPDLGERQFFRIVETVLDIRRDESVVDPNLARIPRRVLPPKALLIVFSPLLDERAIEAVRDLRERRYRIVVMDVLTTEPAAAPDTTLARLALRAWRLDRRALAFRLAELGVPVVPWDGLRPLDETLAALSRRPLAWRHR